MDAINKFIDLEDYKKVAFQCIRKRIDYLYFDVLKKIPEIYGAKISTETKVHWSRDWEYPWAVINSDVKSGERVLDCGCGGSPLLLLLSESGCDAHGVDPEVFFGIRHSLLSYYLASIKKAILVFSGQKKAPMDQSVNALPMINRNIYLHYLKHPVRGLLKRGTLWWYGKDPNKQGYPVKLFEEGLDEMHFEDEYFDKVYCISVIEHLPEEIAFKGMREMARVLKKGGRLVVTLDDNNPSTNPKLVGQYESLIKASGLKLYGSSDFTKPSLETLPGNYHVLGFVLTK